MDYKIRRSKPKVFWKNPFVILCLIGVGYWLYTYHFEHALGFLPYAILILCPFMHIFMHGGHGHGNHSDNDSKESQKEKS